MDEAPLRQAIPDLFTPVCYGPVEAAFVPRNTRPPQHLIGNVNAGSTA